MGGPLSHAVQLRHLAGVQEVQVPRRLHQARAHQVLHHRDAQPVDVHGVPAGKVGQVAQQLGGALGPGAADVGPVLLPLHRRAAHRTALGEAVGLGPLRALLHFHGQHLGNDLSRLAHQNRVSNAYILFRNKILVVEGGAGDCGACQAHRLQHCPGGEHPGAAHLDHDVQHPGGLHLRGILIGRRPAGKFCGAAQQLPLGQVVDLDDRAVDVKGEVLPTLTNGGHLSDGLLHAAAAVMGNHFKALLLQIFQRLHMGPEGLTLRPLDVEYRNVQPPGGSHPGIQLAQGPGGGVPGVGK